MATAHNINPAIECDAISSVDFLLTTKYFASHLYVIHLYRQHAILFAENERAKEKNPQRGLLNVDVPDKTVSTECVFYPLTSWIWGIRMNPICVYNIINRFTLEWFGFDCYVFARFISVADVIVYNVAVVVVFSQSFSNCQQWCLSGRSQARQSAGK